MNETDRQIGNVISDVMASETVSVPRDPAFGEYVQKVKEHNEQSEREYAAHIAAHPEDAEPALLPTEMQEPPSEQELITREQILKDVPLMLSGIEQYDKPTTIEKIVIVMAYDKLANIKQPSYNKHMKPLKETKVKTEIPVTNKKTKGKKKEYTETIKLSQVSKFYPLTPKELLECSQSADILLVSLYRYESEQEEEKLKKVEDARKKAIEEQTKKQIESMAPDIEPDTDVMKVFLDAFHINSADLDDDVAKMVLLSFIGSREISADGLHLKLTGESGTGKTYSVNAALHALPQDAFYSGAFSDKALVYDNTLKAGSIIKLDEAQSKSDVFESILKEAISSYQVGVPYRTVIEKQTVLLPLPPRLTFILLSADNWGDEQSLSRFVPLGLSERNKSTSKRLTQFRLQKRAEGLPKLYVNEVVENAREVLQHFSERTFKVKIPFVKNIEYETDDQRIQEWFESCCMYTAIINYKRRKCQTDEEGNIIVEASKEDFETVRSFSIFKSAKKMESRFTQPEVDIITCLRKNNYEGKDITRSRLVEISGKSDSRVSQILNGRQDRDKNGLMSKIGITEISVSDTEIIEMDNEKVRYGPRTSEKAYRIPILPNVSKEAFDNTVARWVD